MRGRTAWGHRRCGSFAAVCGTVVYSVAAPALVPSLAALWLEASEWEQPDLSSLRLLQVGGAKLDARNIAQSCHLIGGTRFDDDIAEFLLRREAALRVY